MKTTRIIRLLGVFLVFCLTSTSLNAQCNQHVFTSVGAEKWTNFEYLDCDGNIHNFGLPAGGYTIIFCADIGTAFALNGDGFVYPLLTEHPSYASCIQPPCQGDFDGDGIVGAEDLLTFLSNYGICEN
mgnify:FL=1|jgi:hypothetical protein|tara:strand:- start:158 stop:541 length:384 start_codon:yes stop_codon:yes gene_type:complete